MKGDSYFIDEDNFYKEVFISSYSVKGKKSVRYTGQFL